MTVRSWMPFLLLACLTPGQEPTGADERYRALLAQGTQAALAHEWEAATVALTAALELVPDDFEARRWRGHAHTGAGRYDEALADLDAAIDLHDRDAWTHYARAMALHHLGRHLEAIDGYTICLGLDPTLAKAHEWRGFTLSLLGDQVHAIADLDRALALTPGASPKVWFIRGKAYAALLDFERAETDLWRALDAEPENADTLAQLGYLQACAGRDDEAIPMLLAAVREAPAAQVEARLWLFHLLTESGATDAAAAQLKAARSPGAGDATSMRWPRRLAELLAGAIDVDELLEDAPTGGPAAGTAGRICEVWTHAGRESLRRGELDAALRAFAHAIATDAREKWEWSWARDGLRRVCGPRGGRDR